MSDSWLSETEWVDIQAEAEKAAMSLKDTVNFLLYSPNTTFNITKKFSASKCVVELSFSVSRGGNDYLRGEAVIRGHVGQKDINALLVLDDKTGFTTKMVVAAEHGSAISDRVGYVNNHLTLDGKVVPGQTASEIRNPGNCRVGKADVMVLFEVLPAEIKNSVQLQGGQ
jgi:hypothetical protein